MSASIPEELIEQIKERVSILEVISDYLPLKKAGVNYKGLCPFHSEKSPSFTVNEEKQIFHCFGCGAGGNVITFLMRANGMTFPEAVTELAKKAGVAIPKTEGRQPQAGSDKKDILYKLNDAAASFYHRLLGESAEGKGYLEKRGLTEGTVNDYKIGYGGDGWDALFRFLSQKGYSLPLAEELGLIIPKKSGGYYDRFRGRIIFPIFDINGHVVGFGGRSMDGSEPKYLNSPESPLFKKSDSLYGISAAKRWIKESGEALIVEGYMDLLSLHQAGVKNSVATLGTALTPGHLRLLKRFAGDVVTIFDADQAGTKATLRSLDLFLAEGMKARVLPMPAGHDPDTFVREIGAEEFRKKVRTALPIMEFFIRAASRGREPKGIQGTLKVLEEVSPYLSKVSNKIELSHYIKILSEITGVKEELVAGEIRKREGGASGRHDVRFKKITPPPETSRAEKIIIQLAIRYPDLRDELGRSGVLEDFQDDSLRMFGEKLVKAPAGSNLLSYFESEEEKGIYLKMEMEMPEVVDPAKELLDCIRSMRSYRLKKEKEGLRMEMEEAVRKGDENLLMELRERHRQLK